ncbi:MAG: cytidyltransferase [Desulfovibrionales bacterium GWA2_65_9]|nr:MAG: cytidyltransferase [Desulfovibrionales bacterium GWA2_65_9]
MTAGKKILSLEEIKSRLEPLRAAGKTIVHCHGVFDLLHIGHIRYFNQAREMGDVLVVTLTPDRYVDKGAHRPAFSELLRAEAIASLSVADYVAVNDWPTAEETLELLRPNVYVKGAEFKKDGSDRTGKLQKEIEVVERIGARMAFAEDIVFSSSNLINRYLSNFPGEVQEYLGLLRQRYSVETFQDILADMAGLKVLVLGETILDEYHYCEALGKSSKDPVLAVRHQKGELFAGGILAVANHVAQFAGQVTMATVLGETDSQEAFIRSKLAPGVEPVFFYQKNAPTIVKRRYLEGYSMSKLLEVYIMGQGGLDQERDRAFATWVEEHAADYDLVLVADYGHDAVSPRMVETLCRTAPFLAVNTQANAGNRGFNTISRYPRADFVSLADHEMRLEVKAANGMLEPYIKEYGRRMGCAYMVVTRGRKGCSIWSQDERFVEVPAFAQRVVDRIGAGDAFLSITALAARLGVPGEILGFLGNIVGSLAVEIVGNQKSVEKQAVDKLLTSLLK